MSRYVQRILLPDEKITYQAKRSVWSLMPLILLGLIFLIPFGIGLLFLISALLTYLSTELVITNKRVIAKSGFISRNTIELNLTKIESIQVKQGIFGRIFNYGSLVLSGSGNPQAPISGISDPLAFRQSFAMLQEEENSRLLKVSNI